jgi:hypothetical protein
MDRRLYRRRAISLNFRVHDADSDALLGRIGDISQGGFLLYGENPLPTGQVHRLRVDYPDASGKTRSVVFEALTQWSGPDAQPDLQITGLRLVNLDKPATAKALEALLERFTVGENPEAEE